MTVPSQPNSASDKLVAGQVEIKPRVSGDVLADIVLKSGKPGGQVKRKKADEDDILNSNADSSVAEADGAAELAEAQEGPILLAQAGTATTTDAAAASSSTAGAEAGAAGAAGAEAGAVAGTAAMSAGTMALVGLGVVGVAAAASGGGGAAAAAATATGFTLTGAVAAGGLVAGHGLVVEAYKADGTQLAGGTGTVDNAGSFTMAITENYTGPVLVRVIDTNAGNDYIHEGTGTPAELTVDLRTAVNVSGNGTITVNVTPITELAVRELLGDAGGDGGTSLAVLGATVTTTQVTTANTVVQTALGLTGDIVTTTPVTVDAAGFAAATPAQQVYGQVLAAVAGAEPVPGTDTGAVLNTLAQSLSGSTVDQVAVDLLIAGATVADAAYPAAGAATVLTALVGGNISAIDISADTGSNANDFVTQTAAQTITATLDAALSGTKLWGSVDGGATWTDISASVTGTSLTWNGVTLVGASSIKLAVTADTVGAGTVPAFTGATADVVGKISTQSFSVDATAPAFTSATTGDFAENGTGTAYKAIATDANLITYSLSGGADAALFNFDVNSGVATFKTAPNFESPVDTGGDNVYDISVTATDGAGNASTQAVAITVTDANEAPTLTSGAAASFAENATGTVYTAAATDPDAGATLTYALAGTDAALFAIDATTGAVTFSAAPNFEAPGDAGANNVYDITVTASDGANTTAAQAVAITVTDVNEMPSLTSGAAASFAENATGTAYTAVATDPEGVALTYALGGTDAALFAIDATTGAVTFNAAPNFEAPGDAGANNVYDITVTASDGTNTTSAQAVAVTVTNVNEAPTLTSGATSTQTMAVNQAFSNDASGLFADPDAGTTLTYTATGLPAGMSIDANTGVISGTPTATGTATVVITASDGALSVSHTVTANVVTAPVISGITANVAQATSGDALTFTAAISEAVTVTGTPTLTLDVGGTAMTATYTGGTGTSTLTFTATAPATGDDATVTVTAINVNGGSVIGDVTTQPLVTTTTGQVVASFAVDNNNPVFTSATAVNYAENGTAAAYTAAASDTTALTYSLSGADAGLFSINATTGAVSFAASPNFEAPADAGGDNVYNVTVTATDAFAHAANQNVAISVTNVNEAPTVTASPPSAQTFVVNQAVVANNDVTGLFADVDGGDTLTYSQTGLPTGVTLDPQTGLISGTPTTIETANVTFTATDAGGLSVSHAIAVSVVSAPTITNTATLDGVTNLDVRSDLVLTFSDTIALGSGQIRVMDDMGTAGWTLTNTATAESKQDVTDNDVVITLTNGAITALTIGGVDKSAEMADSVTVSGNTLVISPAGSDNASATDWDFDWDFGANYHVELDAGVVTANGVGNVAIADSTTLNFTTVTPTGDATGAASQTMAADGTLTAGYTWHHGHVQDATANGLAMDFSVGSHALMIQSNGLDVATDKSSTTVGGKVLLSGLGIDDVIYMDNGGDMSLLTTDGHKGANYTGSGNTNARLLDNSDGGTQFQTVFADYANTGYTAITALGGADTMLENITHYNANIVIFG